MPDGEAQALRRFLPILSRIATQPERRQIALNIERRINGDDRGLMALSFRQLAALFYPAEDARAEALAHALQAARTAGTLTSIVPIEQGHILVADLAIWPDCPPLPADSPLQYWLPGIPLEGEQPPQECAPTKLPDDKLQKRASVLELFREAGGKRPHEGGKKGTRGALARVSEKTGIDKDTLGPMLDKAIEEKRQADAWNQQLMLTAKR